MAFQMLYKILSLDFPSRLSKKILASSKKSTRNLKSSIPFMTKIKVSFKGNKIKKAIQQVGNV
jgi:hypothetical protein